MLFSQATAGMPGTDAAGKSQHARQLDVNLFSDVKKIRLRDRNLTSEKILTCYRPDPGWRAGPPPALRLHKLNAIRSYAPMACDAVPVAVFCPAFLGAPQGGFRHCGSSASNEARRDINW